ncbi:hypothetical protein H0E87_004040 [Populus deltoides]|uniref:Uncharacterized protein n=1 Tax=Populus deltoides TaxID=3696 RepID=A0A8T2ZDK4_POPDE|nr:hypothetical protein H0E87_004040 [Populus deltoides]
MGIFASVQSRKQQGIKEQNLTMKSEQTRAVSSCVRVEGIKTSDWIWLSSLSGDAQAGSSERKCSYCGSTELQAFHFAGKFHSFITIVCNKECYQSKRLVSSTGVNRFFFQVHENSVL